MDHVKDFRVLLPQPQHDSGFYGNIRVGPRESGQKFEGVGVIRSGTGSAVQARDSFYIVVEEVRQGAGKDIQGLREASPEIRDQNLDFDPTGTLPKRVDDLDEMAGAAVGKIVPVDRSDDDVPKPHPGHGTGNMFGLEGIGRKGFSMVDVAKRAGSGAQVSENHERGGSLPETFSDIRTAGFLADGMQAGFRKAFPERQHIRMEGRGDAEPGRFGDQRRKPGRWFHVDRTGHDRKFLVERR